MLPVLLVFRHLPTLAVFLAVTMLHVWMWRTLAVGGGIRRSRIWIVSVSLGALLSVALVVIGVSLGFARVLARLPAGRWIAWFRAAALGWVMYSFCLAFALWLRKLAPKFDPSRRKLLQAAGGATLAAPVLVGGYGVFIERVGISACPVDLRIKGLPLDLDGLRLSQLTDIHLGPFLGVKELRRAVDIANEFRPHLALMTGDLVSERGDPLDLCIQELSKLRASDGVFGCLGNHEGYLGIEAYTAAECRQVGIDILRGRRRRLSFGKTHLYLLGTDYQKMGGHYFVDPAVQTGEACLNLLLSHNPDVFPVAAAQGYDLIVSGHTHGGQINLEIAGCPLNVARFYTPYIHGEYRRGGSLLYVSRGIGTVGVPLRLGAPPEVNLIRLSAT
jgi:predicted MPP superfamily phosphohydrolase